ncbi:hypothetical protein B0H13DRAFT_2381356 [Mycena leptocephala]|nr:hypothetical protein B0H13DRAFT_2381356 [Mycena leptocephala]
MASMPRWPGLKRFPHVTTVDYADAQSFYDILKCVLPCIVQLLPKNSALVHCIRAYQQYRLMTGLHCTTEERISGLKGYIKKYERFCIKVTKEQCKKFDFPKQHASVHLIDDLREKGTMNNYTTRLGEGFHQEVREAYSHTNGENEDPQLARIDENQEAIALIQMRVDQSDEARRSVAEEQSSETLDPTDEGDESESDQHCIEDEMKRDQRYVKFDAKVQKFLANEVSEQFGDTIMIRHHHCLYLKYQSLEDWAERRDIVQCNPSFHGHLRRDFVLVNTTDSADLPCARLYNLFTCKSLDGRQHDIALVTMLKHSSWRPNTLWDGCPFDSGKQNITYLIDASDYDMFLRAGN